MDGAPVHPSSEDLVQHINLPSRLWYQDFFRGAVVNHARKSSGCVMSAVGDASRPPLARGVSGPVVRQRGART
ncbi:hypothetical protein BDW71DRAFT_189795 [Aspergillus fruticulosus]